MRVGSKTDIGKKRENNEDFFLVDQEHRIFIVADGMGGHQGGEVASRLACEIVHSFLQQRLRPEIDRTKLFGLIEEAVLLASKEIKAKANQNVNLYGMRTTLVMAVFRDEGVYIAHAGDSRAYLIGEGGIRQLTEDHSVARELVKKGFLSEDEAKSHPLKHHITRVVGIDGHSLPDIQFFKLNGGEYILLCSDGLTNMLTDEEILVEIKRYDGEVEHACDALISLANEKGGKDNITIILCYNNKEENNVL